MSRDCLKEVMTPSEVDALWKKPPGTTKLNISRNKFKNSEIRKSAGTWLVSKQGAERVFGQMQEKKED